MQQAIHYGWVILVTAFIIHFFGGGSRFAFGLMLKPMVEDLDWNRTTVSSLVTTFMLISAAGMPLAGRLIDKFSLRAILAAGISAGGIGIALMKFVTSPYQAFALYGVVNGLGNAAASNPTIGTMVSRWFRENTGTAISIASSGNGVGQLIIIALLASAIDSLGWRNAFGLLGSANLIFVLPLVLVTVKAPSSRPIKLSTSLRHGTDIKTAQPTIKLISLLKSKDFVLLVVIYCICGFQDFFVLTHIVPFAGDLGINPNLAGNMLALMGVFGLVGVILSGIMSDAFGPTRPTLLCFVIRIVTFALALSFQQTYGIIGFAFLYGFTFMITAPLSVVFARNLFGTANLGFISGILSMTHQVSGGIGALFGASIFDAFQTYNLALSVMLGLAIAGTVTTMAINNNRTLVSNSASQ